MAEGATAADHADFSSMIKSLDSILDHGNVDGFRAAFATMLATMRAHFRAEEERLSDSEHPLATEHAVEHKVLLHMANHVAKMTTVTSDVQYLKFSLRSIASLLAEHAVREV